MNPWLSLILAAVLAAPLKAQDAGEAVLAEADKMVKNREIVRGACWDFINLAYKRAGFPNTKKARKVVFKSKKSGPYVDIEKIQPGDWLYHVNYSYNGIEHSGMFVEWTDKAKKMGKTLSYAGEKRAEPGRYRVYDLRSVYQITRPQP